MWIANARLQQGESLNVQDVKTNLFWEFGKFTSRDGESMESYYTRFYKMMNEMRTVTVVGARETVGSQVVQQTRIQCFNCKEFEQVDWLEDMDEEDDEQELEARYSFMAKIQEVLPADLGTDVDPLER
nr:hypothetical protein [Tanacetum cinerariifolium]